MAHIFLLALASISLGHQQAPQVPQPFIDREDIADLTRLALTPKLDGKIDTEEWDPFVQSNGMDTYFQWEPGKLYLAARAPLEDEVVFSLDLGNNGWLVGRDNVEIRMRRSEAGLQVRGRVLDAENKTGPKWIDMPGLAAAANVASSVSDDGKTWTGEVALNDPGTGYFPMGPGNIGARVDMVPMDGTEVASYVPRLIQQIKLGYKRATGLPGGVYWEPQHEGQYVAPGRSMSLRYTFKGEEASIFQRVAMRSEGFTKESTNALEVPFPKLDKKGRAFVDYNTRISDDAPVGYRVARCMITSKDGATAMGQASYRVAPDIDMELVREDIKQSNHPNVVKATIYLRSNSPQTSKGILHMTPPAGFSIISGNDMPFVLYKTQTVRRVMQINVPSNAVGTYSFDLTSKVGNDSFHHTAFLTIQY
jgi:hypothetical protein